MAYVFIGIVAVLILILVLRSGHSMTATLTHSGIKSSKGISPQLLKRIDEFAQDNIEADLVIQIFGVRGQGNRIRWSCSKNAGPEFAQRFRNFMTNEV